ncbi:MAG: hypothetical protein ACRD59_02790 [Candidatus Acidiferrales bacterium]
MNAAAGAAPHCQLCSSNGPAASVGFHRNVGMLLARRTYIARGYMCRSCLGTTFWEFTLKNIVQGPWGMISLVVTPIYILKNTGVYLVALYKLRQSAQLPLGNQPLG